MDLAMDFELISIVVGVVAVTAAAVYLVSVMGVREKSFEEAIAEQKQRSEQLLGVKPPREKKKTAPVNKGKKQQKRVQKHQQQPTSVAAASTNGPTEVTTTAQVHEGTPPHHHVEIDPEPIILDERPFNPERRRSSVSGDSIKSILVNKAEHSPVLDNAELEKTPVNHFESIHPKDDCELKKQWNHDETPPETPPPTSGKLSSKKKEVMTIEEVGGEDAVDSLSYPPQESKAEDTRVKSKARKAVRSVEKEEVSIVKVEETITKMSLSSSEIQSLIDILLNKQHGDSEWVNKGKNDSATNLKKQLAEKEQQLLNEQSTIQTLHSKIKEIRQEFNNEKSTFSHVRRQLEDSANSKKLELQQLQARFQNHCESTQQEKAQLQQQLQQAQVTLKSLRDENVGIKSALANLEQGSRGKADSLEREAEAIRVQCSHLENQLQAAFNSNQELTNRNQTLQASLRALEERKIKDEQLIHGNFASQMQERESHFVSELKRNQVETEKEKNNFRQQINILQKSVGDSQELAEEMRRRYEDSQKSEKNAKNLLQDAENKVKDFENKLLSQDAVINTKGDADKIMEEQFAEMQAKLAKHESKLSDLDLEKTNLTNELDTRNQDLKFQKEKNDELRKKNAKLMETLTAAETNLEHQVRQLETAVKGAEEKTRHMVEEEIKKTFKQLFPTAVVESDKTDWMKRFAESVKEKSAAVNLVPTSSVDSEELTRLQGEVKHYQTILVSTEKMLTTLQQSVEKAELDWRIKLEKAEEEILALKSAANKSSDPLAVKVNNSEGSSKTVH
jgi:ribosome-binding protein 1